MVTRSPQSGKSSKIPVKKTVNQTNQLKNTNSPDINQVAKILDSHTKHLTRIDETLSILKDELKVIKDAVVTVKSQPIATQPVKQSKISSSWHSKINPKKEYTQKEIIDITKISQPTLSMAKVRGHIKTRSPPGVRGWVVKGEDLLAWDKNRAVNTGGRKKNPPARSVAKKPASQQSSTPQKAGTTSLTSVNGKKPLVIQNKETKALTTQKPTSPAKGAATKPASKATKPAASVKGRSDNQSIIPNDIPDRINALTLKKVVTQTQFGNDVGLPQKVIYEISTRKLKILNPEIIQKITSSLKSYEAK